MFELFDVDVAIAVDIKCVEGVLNVLFRNDFVMVDRSGVKFLKIDFAVSIKVTILEDFFPFVAEFDRTFNGFFGYHELLQGQMTITVYVKLLKCNF